MEIIKYHNDINTLKLGTFTEKEIDVFFALLVRVRDKKEDVIVLDFYDLKELSSGDKSRERFIKCVIGLANKLKSITQTLEVTKGVWEVFSLFDRIKVDSNENFVEITVNQTFKYLVNDLIGNFTIFDLKEMLELSGSYAKTLFRLLKQWESTKRYEVELATFKELLGISSTYKMCNIDQRILSPALEELQKYFKDLKLEKIKRGREVHKLVFTWKKGTKNKTDKVIEWNFLESEDKAEKKQELRKQDEEQQEKVIENLKEQKERFEEEQEKLFELFKSSLTADLEKEIRKYLIESNQTSEIDLECIKKLNKNVYLKTLLNAYKKMINVK